MNIGVLVGVSKYDHEIDLPFCNHDVKAMKTLLVHSGKYSEENILVPDTLKSAPSVKKEVRGFLHAYLKQDVGDIVIYLSGHGTRVDNEYAFALRQFVYDRERSTSISLTELDDWIRVVQPKVYCRIIDSCFCGTNYIKGTDHFRGGDLRNDPSPALDSLYFLSSSRWDQGSSGPYPPDGINQLSLFTHHLVDSVATFVEDSLTYPDLVKSLQDKFQKYSQTPHWVCQSDINVEFVPVSIELRNALIPYIGGVKLPSEDQHEAPSITSRIHHDEQMYFKQDEANNYLSVLRSNFDSLRLESEIASCYDLSIDDQSASLIYGDSYFCQWFQDNDIPKLFLKLKRESFYVDVAGNRLSDKEVDRLRAKVRRDSTLAYRLQSIRNLFIQALYQKSSSVISFSRTEEGPWRDLTITATPSVRNLPKWEMIVTYVLGQRQIVVLARLSRLERIGWDAFESESCDHACYLYSKHIDATATPIHEKIIKLWSSSIQKYIDVWYPTGHGRQTAASASQIGQGTVE